jgi:hypothetical protein
MLFRTGAVEFECSSAALDSGCTTVANTGLTAHSTKNTLDVNSPHLNAIFGLEPLRDPRIAVKLLLVVLD